MDKLEFENFNLGDDEASNENEQLSDQEPVQHMNESEAIELSSKIVEALSTKVKEYNKDNPEKKVTVAQLKKVYHRGAKVTEEDKGLWAMARVNMFLRMKKGGNVAIADKKVEIKINELIDISANWVPSEEDFSSAGRDIECHKLSNFDNINDLYLEEYKRIENWVFWG